MRISDLLEKIKEDYLNGNRNLENVLFKILEDINTIEKIVSKEYPLKNIYLIDFFSQNITLKESYNRYLKINIKHFLEILSLREGLRKKLEENFISYYKEIFPFIEKFLE